MYYDIEKSSRRIRKLRVETGYTQEFIADQIGISLDGYRKIERGVNGAKVDDTLVAIAELYGVSLDYLVYGQVTPNLETVSDSLTERETKFLLAIFESIKENMWLLNDRYGG